MHHCVQGKNSTSCLSVPVWDIQSEETQITYNDSCSCGSKESQNKSNDLCLEVRQTDSEEIDVIDKICDSKLADHLNEFGDFRSSQFTNSIIDDGLDHPELYTYQLLVRSVFNFDPTTTSSITSTNSAETFLDKKVHDNLKNVVSWAHVQDFEDSHCLVFKWVNSNAHQRLLKCLNINTSALMYSSKWGSIAVPKFAACLLDSPLQPEHLLQPVISSPDFEDFQSHKEHPTEI